MSCTLLTSEPIIEHSIGTRPKSRKNVSDKTKTRNERKRFFIFFNLVYKINLNVLPLMYINTQLKLFDRRESSHDV